MANATTFQWVAVLCFVAACSRTEAGGSATGSGVAVTGNESSIDMPWVMKCCNLTYGYKFENKSLCVETEDEFLPDFEDSSNYSETAKDLPVKDRYEYFIGDPCLDGKYILDMILYPYDKYSIYSNGTLLYLDQLFTQGEYCLESLNATVRAFVCFGAEKRHYELDFRYVLYAAGLLLSIPFLLATAIVYLSIDVLRDVPGKSLSCHVLCLAVAYLVLATVQLGSDQLHPDLCIIAGFVIQYFFVAAFFWLNVICYSTWRCLKDDFRCARKPLDLNSETNTFLLYFMYGWFGPTILLIVSLIMDLEPAIPESYLKPNFGLRSCWFHSDDAALPYFYGPVGVVILVNIIFFGKSVCKIYKEYKRLRETQNHDSVDEIRGKFVSLSMYIRILRECFYLFAIMGINWAAEVISWAVGGSFEIWLVTDMFNTLQGVMIFYLYVINRKRVRNLVKKRLLGTWKKIIKCDCSHKEEESRRTSRHWHANICEQIEESRFDKENETFVPLKDVTAV